jgi:hypothetical protein
MLVLCLGSCENFFDPEQSLVIETENFYRDWSHYRSAEMGLYYLQQQLVDQIVILGELRGDLLEITPYADRDLIEVYNYQVTRENKFASPRNFYRLIGACNSLIVKLESAHPEVLSDEDPTDYDRLYGEAKCMRAWAYFNAVRIYGKVPYVWPSLTTVNEISDYVNSGGEFIDSVNIVFDVGGYYNDTSYNQPVVLERVFLDMSQVIDTFTKELENDIKAVGVIHNKDNNDLTWDVTVWNYYAYKCLLGQMYLHHGDLMQAERHFRPIMYNDDSETSFIKFGLDNRFERGNWKNIFSGIDGYEHIYTIWFDKSYQQQHSLQKYFSKIPPNQYMLKPTRLAVHNWETIWDGMIYYIENTSKPELTTMAVIGEPGDWSRGHGISYVYMDGEEIMPFEDVYQMTQLRKRKLYKDAAKLMIGKDTLVYKYTYGKQPYDQDANYIVYRAAGIHLYYAEIYARWEWLHDNWVRPEVNFALKVVNNGSYAYNSDQMGIRGRVGFGGELCQSQYGYNEDDEIKVSGTIYLHDPFTNELIGYRTLQNLLEKQEYLEDQIIEERARELAFEGERFFDLIRIAKRRNDPAYLANKVPADGRKKLVHSLLRIISNPAYIMSLIHQARRI